MWSHVSCFFPLKDLTLSAHICSANGGFLQIRKHGRGTLSCKLGNVQLLYILEKGKVSEMVHGKLIVGDIVMSLERL